MLVGNFIFDFDVDAMARILRVPSEMFRDKVHRALRQYMTSMKQELGTLPDRRRVMSLYLQKCREALGCDLEAGELSRTELAEIDRLDRRFTSEEFLHRPGGLKRDGVKIHEDVWIHYDTEVPRGS